MRNWKQNSFGRFAAAVVLGVWTLTAAAAPPSNSDSLRTIAEQGDAASQLALGLEYFNGVNRTANRTAAVLWFRRAAAQGVPEAWYNLGMALKFGAGAEKSDYEAFQAFGKAVVGGVDAAKLERARYLVSGVEAEVKRDDPTPRVAPDIPAAIALYRELAAKDNPEACRELAERLLIRAASGGESPADDRAEAVKLLNRAIAKGDVQAMRMLGDCYRSGVGVEIDFEQMNRLLAMATEEGDAEAAALLGFNREFGLGSRPDRAEAIRLYQFAAERGSMLGLAKIGDALLVGDVLSPDVAKGVAFLREAADNGNAYALYKIGRCYADGIGVELNPVRAAFYYSQAAELGDVNAQYELGMAFMKGKGVASNAKSAFKWLSAAADKNDPRALRELARCYYSGIGTEKDPERGLYCIQLAAQAGDEQSQYLLQLQNRSLEEQLYSE